MAMKAQLKFRKGFNPLLIQWGAPNQRRTEVCSYCEAQMDDDEVPLMMWNSAGWCAEFCESCQKKWLTT